MIYLKLKTGEKNEIDLSKMRNDAMKRQNSIEMCITFRITFTLNQRNSIQFSKNMKNGLDNFYRTF